MNIYLCEAAPGAYEWWTYTDYGIPKLVVVAKNEGQAVRLAATANAFDEEKREGEMNIDHDHLEAWRRPGVKITLIGTATDEVAGHSPQVIMAEHRRVGV